MTGTKQINALNPAATFTDTSFFATEDSSAGNVSEKTSGLVVKAYLTNSGFLNATNLGTSVQQFSANLGTIAGLAQGTGKVIVSNGTAWTSAALVDSSIATGAAISLSKLAAVTNGKVLQSNTSTGVIEASSISNATLAFLDATSSIQTQINGKVNTSDIGSTVEAYDATILKTADIGTNVEAFDATILKSAAIGVSVEGFDATILKSANIGSTVQAHGANLDTISALAQGTANVIRSNGTVWQSSKLAITDLTGVVITTPATNNTLAYNGTNFVNVSVLTLASLNTNTINAATGNITLTPTSGVVIAGSAVQLPVYTLTAANALSTKAAGQIIYVSNGNAGAATLAAYDGTNWKVVALGATIS